MVLGKRVHLDQRFKELLFGFRERRASDRYIGTRRTVVDDTPDPLISCLSVTELPVASP
jgi:hypothetical protein